MIASLPFLLSVLPANERLSPPCTLRSEAQILAWSTQLPCTEKVTTRGPTDQVHEASDMRGPVRHMVSRRHPTQRLPLSTENGSLAENPMRSGTGKRMMDAGYLVHADWLPILRPPAWVSIDVMRGSQVLGEPPENRQVPCRKLLSGKALGGPAWEAGILPLNYARKRQNRRYHAIVEGYASRSRGLHRRFSGG